MLISYIKSTKIQYVYKMENKLKLKQKLIIKVSDQVTYFRLVKNGFLSLVSLMWCIIGLLSSNWLAFLVIIILYIVLMKLFSNIGDAKKMNYVRTILYMLVYTLFSLSILFISLNHYYLGYNLTLIIKKIIVL